MAIHAQPGSNPSPKWEAVTKSDSTGFVNGCCRALYVGGTGDVVAVDQDGGTVTFSAVPAGTVLPIMAIRVNSTSTTATLMVAMF
jgi:hypothetical protein